ncbi:MAG: hypothetical protein ACO2Y9_11620, partial [Pseudohongiellaceae bacterium]
MQTYLVGGAVRDKLLGLETKDRDWVVVGAAPQEMLDLGYQQVGQAFVSNGRFLSVSDNETRRNIAVIGMEVRDDLSLPQDP